MALSRDTLERLRIDHKESRGFRLSAFDTKWLPDQLEAMPKDERRASGEQILAASKAELEAAQDILYADDRFALLLVFQAMDAAGKDGTIKHVMSGVNPQGCSVTSFKQPSAEELDHDYLWRAAKALPERGRIGIFNRSHYEEVLITRVHPEILQSQKLPPGPRDQGFWRARYEDINAFERHLDRNGTVVLKFFLHLSKEEQRKRFLERLDHADKNWKFSSADVKERGFWDAYQVAFEEMIQETSTDRAPWWVIPADRKWAMRALVADIVSTTVTGMGLRYPEVSADERIALKAARAALEAE
ncbi:MAG: polyphosphate kinase 2 family protein [Candidatus Nanopelagicales bacterium]|nr:polyphosphate kinase 2 family protein [Candidatus Nanopelagicales bacterium]MDZ4249295.1 polyphosphate kinase 2 family protein [Candidatus Nanopelagicales bacterium]